MSVTTHMFVDETKAKAYVMVAVVCPAARVNELRMVMRGLVLPGQRSIHMKNESAQRRRVIADVIGGLAVGDVEAIVLDAGPGPASELDRRGRCLDVIGAEAIRRISSRVVLDLDETLVSFDRRRLRAAVATNGRVDVAYGHASRHEEPLLALPDVVAWCWARGGEWRRRVSPLVVDLPAV